MRVTDRALVYTLVLVGAILSAPSSRATVINANYYPVGTNLTHAIPFATLEDAVGQTGGTFATATFTTSPLIVGSVDAVSGDILGAQPVFINTLGSATEAFAGYPDEPGWRALYAVFAHPVHDINVRYVNCSTDVAWFFAFDVNGKFIAGPVMSGSLSCRPLMPIGSTTPYTLNFESSTPIGSILVGSWSSAGYVTALDIPGLPEPSTFALFGGGIMVVGIFALRRRRRPAGSLAD